MCFLPSQITNYQQNSWTDKCLVYKFQHAKDEVLNVEGQHKEMEWFIFQYTQEAGLPALYILTPVYNKNFFTINALPWQRIHA